MSFARRNRLCSQMGTTGSSTIVCDVRGLAADGATVDVLARLQLAARRLGLEIQLRHASRELQDLLAFAGLSEVLRVEAGGQAEQREQRLGVEEERELDDPAV
jgi:ABC-type transporter Mla MlaB component